MDISQINKEIKDSNLIYPAGTAKENYFEYLIRTEGEFKSIEEITKHLVFFQPSIDEDRLKQETAEMICCYVAMHQ